MERKVFVALIAVVALVCLAAAAVAANQESSVSGSNSYQAAPTASLGASNNGNNGALNFLGPTGQPLPPGQPLVIISSDPQSGFHITGSAGAYTAVWTLQNTGTKSMTVQPYVIINGVLYLGPTTTIQPGQTTAVSTGLPAGVTQPATADVNVRELRGDSSNFWVAYDLNQPVTV